MLLLRHTQLSLSQVNFIALAAVSFYVLLCNTFYVDVSLGTQSNISVCEAQRYNVSFFNKNMLLYLSYSTSKSSSFKTTLHIGVYYVRVNFTIY